MTKKKRNFQPQAWQKDPQNVKTSTVQLWSASGIMLTAQLPLEKAREMVTKGEAFVICDQAVGYF